MAKSGLKRDKTGEIPAYRAAFGPRYVARGCPGRGVPGECGNGPPPGRARVSKLTLIDFDIATLFGFPRTRELVDRRELDQKSYADLLTELHGEVCTANTGAAARAAAARARWNRPVT